MGRKQTPTTRINKWTQIKLDEISKFLNTTNSAIIDDALKFNDYYDILSDEVERGKYEDDDEGDYFTRIKARSKNEFVRLKKEHGLTPKKTLYIILRACLRANWFDGASARQLPMTRTHRLGCTLTGNQIHNDRELGFECPIQDFKVIPLVCIYCNHLEISRREEFQIPEGYEVNRELSHIIIFKEEEKLRHLNESQVSEYREIITSS